MGQETPLSSSELVQNVIDNAKVSGLQLLVIGLCFFLNMLDGFDITSMAIVANSVGTELLLGPDQIGWIFSFALGGMMLGAMVLAPYSDIIGRRKLILLSLALVGVSVLLTAFANSLIAFIILRFVAGLGAGAMLACQATLADEYSPIRFRTLAVAIVTSGYPAGAMMTSVIGDFILPEYGWRGMFGFAGAFTLCMVFVASLLLPESLKFLLERRPDGALERTNKILSKLGKNPLREMPHISHQDAARKPGIAAAMRLLIAPRYRKQTLQLWLAMFLSFASVYFLMSWIPKQIQDVGFTASDGRRAFFYMNLGAIVGVYVLGVLSTWLKLTNLIAGFFLICATGMFAYAAAPTEFGVLLPLIFLIGLFQQGGFTAMYSVAAKTYPTEIRSTGVGWAAGLGRSGAVAGPVVAGYLIAGGLGMSANFIVFAIPMALSAVLVYALHIR